MYVIRGMPRYYIIITSQATGASGMEYTFYLTGQHDFSGMVDTLKYISSPDETIEKTREGQVSVLKMGLVRYIMRTPMSGYTEISFTEGAKEELADDPWNNWVIRLFLGGMLRGEKTSKYSNIWGGFNVGRVTEEWKMEFAIDMGNNVEKFELEEGDSDQ